jgi:hypothetical protein
MSRWLLLGLLMSSSASGGEVLTNYDTLCSNTGALGPGPGEEAHIAATRLATLDVPFEVTSVRARLHHGSVGGVMCDASMPRQLMMWKSTSDTPDAQPLNAVTVSFDVEETLGEERLIESVLDTPITLSAGEYLWAAIDFGGAENNVGCIKTCRSNAEDGVNFWSNADQAPYNWADLGTIGANGSLWVEVVGNPPEGVLPEPMPEPEVEADTEAEEEPTRRRGRRR